MTKIDWDSVFTEVLESAPGASDAVIEEFVDTVLQPVSASEFSTDETKSIIAGKQQLPELWIIPSLPLPNSYIDFLRWSNGGSYQNGERVIQFFSTTDLRAYILSYRVPYYHPGIVPFAFNQGGIFYGFDMRFRPQNGEYKIVAIECSYAHKSFVINSSFPEACMSSNDFEIAWDEEDEIIRPLCQSCSEFLICPECGERGPTRHEM